MHLASAVADADADADKRRIQRRCNFDFSELQFIISIIGWPQRHSHRRRRRPTERRYDDRCFNVW